MKERTTKLSGTHFRTYLEDVQPHHRRSALERLEEVGRGPVHPLAELVEGGDGVHLGEVLDEPLVDHPDLLVGADLEPTHAQHLVL